MKKIEILFRSPMMIEQVSFTSVSDMITFLQSQMSVVKSYYGDKVITLDTFQISVLPSSTSYVFSISFPVDSDSKKIVDDILTWMSAIEKIIL